VTPLPDAPRPLDRAAAATGSWRFLDSGAADGATNMAADVTLLEHARATGESTLRVYAWSTPTHSFGRHERAHGRFDAGSLRAQGVDAVRRPTGGRALLHHREVTYSVTAPVDGVSLAESYRAINALLAGALQALGVTVEAATRSATSRPLRPGTAACFAEPNEGELTLDGAKLAGSAQWREDGALLQHGSILIADDQVRIASLAIASADGSPAVEPILAPVATLSGALRRPVAYDEVRDALRDALVARCRAQHVTSPTILTSDSGTSDAAFIRHREHFRDPAWTWRRGPRRP
jgi:lipoate-protein ligase A